MKALIGLTLVAMLVADQPRKVLLFYTENGLAKWKAQMNALEGHRKDILERDIEIKSFPYSKQNAQEWHRWELDTANAFTFILIGRDGGEKLKSSEVVTPDKLFGLIDAMPMRKQEIKQNP
ncbi:DUF4174 domain-containing protein [Dyadobacter sp. LJ53]|uniref:DUF4174 domain-containing protein n=1 Tax=Dyadobacter chenwenxiniae TaxID=2906456 RepID=UPI001F1A7722|nr:DUF4174 domain-containing protein [Dyadobacter chenwenxiniae]MCF0049134.1 DUF4174 domain-containing protein [Dyadobacter chenwenxiniae]